MADNNAVSNWTGWVLFAGVLLIIGGIVQALYGLGVLLNSTFLVVTPAHVVVADATAWGWIHLILGVIVLAAGFSVMHGSLYGRIVAIFVTGLALIGNITYISVYPVWSIIAILIDVLVLYALTMHGHELQEVA